MSDLSRRSFLCTTTCALGGAVAAVALLPADLGALPVHLVDGTPVGRAERAFPIPAGDSVNIDRQISMILVRTQSKVFAFALSCPHERAAVKWEPKNGRFACSKHDSKYLPDGKYISGRATRSLDRFPIRKDGTNVVVTLDVVFRSDQHAAGWAAAEVAV